jgi:tripartite ATP-independent transporter DctM subunit
MDTTLYFVLGLFVFAALGMPIAFVLILTSMLMFTAIGNMKMMAIPQNMVGGVDSFILMAVPLFILAGKVMNTGKVTDRIFNFASTLVGHIKGGLGHVNILGSLIFAGISGSAVADAAGLGEVEIRAMRARGYDDRFTAAITASSSVIGPIFPPSVPMVIYAGLTGVSVARLFLGGAIPGIVMAAFLMAATYVIAVRRGFPSEPRASLREIARSLRSAFFAILSPVIVLGAIVTGITTPTEAAVVAVLYSLLLGFFYRTLRLRDLPRLAVETGIETGVLMLIVAAVAIFSWILTYQMLPQALMDVIFGYTKSPVVVITLLVGLLLILGCFMNPTPGLVVSVPFILPLAEGLGIDLVHLGVLMVLVLAIGLLTPPVGLCVFIVARIAQVDCSIVFRECTPYIITLVLVSLLVAYVPQVVLFVPNLLLGKG